MLCCLIQIVDKRFVLQPTLQYNGKPGPLLDNLLNDFNIRLCNSAFPERPSLTFLNRRKISNRTFIIYLFGSFITLNFFYKLRLVSTYCLLGGDTLAAERRSTEWRFRGVDYRRQTTYNFLTQLLSSMFSTHRSHTTPSVRELRN